MTEISRVALFGKLNKLGYQAVESATVFCKMRGNPYVEVVHWMHQILNAQDSDIHRIVQHYDLDPGAIATEITRALDRLPRGATTISDLSEHLMDAMERGWVWGSLLYSSNQVRTGHLLLGMLKTPSLRNILQTMSPELGRIGPDDLADHFANTPPAADYPVNWPSELGEPDLILTIPNQNIPANGEVDYRYIQMQPNIPANTWLRAAIILPENREVVHHSLVFLGTVFFF